MNTHFEDMGTQGNQPHRQSGVLRGMTAASSITSTLDVAGERTTVQVYTHR